MVLDEELIRDPARYPALADVKVAIEVIVGVGDTDPLPIIPAG
jgi:hypothetical protein